MRKLAAIGIGVLAAVCWAGPAAGQSTVGSAAPSGVRSGGARVPARPPNKTPPPPDAFRQPVPGRHARPGVFRTADPTPPTPDVRLGAGGIRPRTGNIVYPGTPGSTPNPGSILTPGTPPRQPAPTPRGKRPKGPRGPRTLVYPVFAPAYGYDLDGYSERPYVEEPYVEEPPAAPVADERPAAGPQRIGGRSRVIEVREREPAGDYTLVGLRGGLIYAARELEIGDEVVRFTTVQGDRFVLSRAELDEAWTAELNADRERSSTR